MGKKYNLLKPIIKLYGIYAGYYNSEEYFGPDRTGLMYHKFLYLKSDIEHTIKNG